MSVRDLDDRVKEKLRRRAAANGRSMEAEIRAILTEAVDGSPQAGLVWQIGERVRAAGGVELEVNSRRGHRRSR